MQLIRSDAVRLPCRTCWKVCHRTRCGNEEKACSDEIRARTRETGGTNPSVLHHDTRLTTRVQTKDLKVGVGVNRQAQLASAAEMDRHTLAFYFANEAATTQAQLADLAMHGRTERIARLDVNRLAHPPAQRQGLKEELEAYEVDLQKTASVHQMQYAKLHERRTEVDREPAT